MHLKTICQLIRAQISKIIQSGVFLGAILIKLADPLLKVANPLGKIFLFHYE